MRFSCSCSCRFIDCASCTKSDRLVLVLVLMVMSLVRLSMRIALTCCFTRADIIKMIGECFILLCVRWYVQG